MERYACPNIYFNNGIKNWTQRIDNPGLFISFT